MSRCLAPLLLSLGLAAAACGGDDDDGAAVDAAPSATCDRGVIEPDNEAQGPLAGPGVDPETGELRAPPAAGYHVSTTYLQIQPDAQQLFSELVAPIVQQLGAQPGLLAIQLTTSVECGTGRTLTIWESEEAMFGFVLGDVHQAAVGRIDDVSRGASAFATWTATSLDQTTWEAAADRLADVEGPLY
jgi:heme-degrading monooxygenase HmoA